MPHTDKHSAGLVEPKVARFEEPIALASGRELAPYEIVYETYGTLNEDRSNAVLICHALSGHHHAAGYHTPEDKKPGWWDDFIGPGKPVDTAQFFVVCLNNLGGCHGSTGPASINPQTGEAWGPDFPHMRTRGTAHGHQKVKKQSVPECLFGCTFLAAQNASGQSTRHTNNETYNNADNRKITTWVGEQHSVHGVIKPLLR